MEQQNESKTKRPSILSPSTVTVSLVDVEDLCSDSSTGCSDDGRSQMHIYLHGKARVRPPIVPAFCPYRVTLQAGKKYLFCSCGRSKKQPFCDGTHLKGDPKALVVSVPVTQEMRLCGCKYSANLPYCDGSHIHVEYGSEELEVKQSIEE